MLKRLLSIGLGGFFGAISRFYLGNFLTGLNTAGFPTGTLLINLIGCFLLGLFLTLVLDHLKVGVNYRLAVGTGFIGAFTTFSTFSVETVWMLANNQTNLAFLYVGLSLIGGLSCTYTGFYLAKKIGSSLTAKQQSTREPEYQR